MKVVNVNFGGHAYRTAENGEYEKAPEGKYISLEDAKEMMVDRQKKLIASIEEFLPPDISAQASVFAEKEVESYSNLSRCTGNKQK